MALQIKLDPGKMMSVKKEVFKGFQTALLALLNATPIGMENRTIEVTCISQQHGSASHSGKIELKAIGPHSLFVYYQHTGNDTRFLYKVVVPSSWMKPGVLHEMLEKVLKDSPLLVEKPAVSPTVGKLAQTAVVILPPSLLPPTHTPQTLTQASPVASQSTANKTMSLRGFTKDPSSIELLLMELRGAAKDGFVPYDTAIEKLMSLASCNKFSASQSLRRIVEKKMIVAVDGGFKIPDEVSKKVESPLAVRIAELVKLDEKHHEAARRMTHIPGRIRELESEKTELLERLKRIDAELTEKGNQLDQAKKDADPSGPIATASAELREIRRLIQPPQPGS